MPLPLIAITIPVLHSSGAWIASTAAGGYVAATLSPTWIGAFVLGNKTLLASVGLVSAAGIFGAGGGFTALASGATAGLGAGLVSVGLGGVANALGIAPVTTFLGLTPMGWVITGTAATVIATAGYFFTRKTMRRMNEERAKGGLEPITIVQIIKEVKLLEAQSLQQILRRLQGEGTSVMVFDDRQEVKIDGQTYSISRLRYVINRDGSEEIVFVTRTARKRRVFLVKCADRPGFAAT